MQTGAPSPLVVLGDLDGSKADTDRCALPIGGAGGSGRLQGRCRQVRPPHWWCWGIWTAPRQMRTGAPSPLVVQKPKPLHPHWLERCGAPDALWRRMHASDVKGCDVDVKGYDVDAKDCDVDVKGCYVGVKGCDVDVKGYDVDVKGCDVDAKGCDVDVKGCDVDAKDCDVDVKGCDVGVKGF
eukprot:1187903-Prorocentrum_minimum.AAC.1